MDQQSCSRGEHATCVLGYPLLIRDPWQPSVAILDSVTYQAVTVWASEQHAGLQLRSLVHKIK